MKKVLLTLLTVIVVLGLFATNGYAGYRSVLHGAHRSQPMGTLPGPQLRPFDDLDRPGSPHAQLR